MKNYFLIFFLLILSCSTPNSDLNIKVDDLKKEGNILIQNSNEIINYNYISNINKTLTNLPVEIKDWYYPNYNSENLIPHIKINKPNFSKIKKINIGYNLNQNQQIISTHDKLVFVDEKSNIIILNKQLEILKKKKLYNNKSYPKSYILKFSLIINNNIIYISDNLGSIWALDLNSLKILWNNNLEVPFVSNLAVYEKSIFVINSNGKIYSFDLISGKQNWKYDSGSNYIKSSNAFKILVSNHKLFFTNDFGLLTCIDLIKKSIIWEISIEKIINSNLFYLNDLIVENNYIYISSSFGQILKIDLINGKILWKNKILFYENLFLNKETVASIDNYFLKFYDKNNGKLIYKKNLFDLLKLNNSNKEKFFLNNILLVSNNFYITANNGTIFIVQSDKLDDVSIIKNFNSVESNLMVFNNNLVFVTDKRNLIQVQ